MIFKMIHRHTRFQGRAKRAAALGLGLLLGGLSACDGLLDVDLPAQLSDDALEDPKSAQMLVNSAIALFECGYSTMAWRILGDEDVFESIAGVANGAHRYIETVPVGDCDDNGEDDDWYEPMSSARFLAAGLHNQLQSKWTDEQVRDREKLQAIAALYVAAPLDVFGSYLCEAAVDAGPLLTPDQTLSLGEEWIAKALAHIGKTGDFEMPHGVTAPSDGKGAETMAYALRARMRWAKGDKAGALADIARVPQGFTAWITRDQGLTRRNKVFQAGTAAGFSGMLDVNTWWSGPPNPVTGKAWPNPIPFTGYLHLGILPDGRAVGEDGLPVRTTVAAAAVKDPRVPHFLKSIQGPEPRHVPNKFKADADDIPLVSWRELWLIRAELEGGQQAVNLVNELRTFHGLPEVTYVNPGNAEQVRRMIIEERRRELFTEGRYLATKIQNTDLLWFPRAVGTTPSQGYLLGGAVRYAMPESEYTLNKNLGLNKRATGCPASQAPVFLR